MDDEAPIRMMISRLLTHIGIGDIETAADGTDAVGIYKYARSVNRPFSAVILDMTVPGGIGGLDVIEKLRSIDPEVKVILTSGHANAIDEPAMKERGFCAILDKPYTLDQMRQTLLQVLDLVAEPV
jgi:DNA-binding NtrC family response regulator